MEQRIRNTFQRRSPVIWIAAIVLCVGLVPHNSGQMSTLNLTRTIGCKPMVPTVERFSPFMRHLKACFLLEQGVAVSSVQRIAVILGPRSILDCVLNRERVCLLGHLRKRESCSTPAQLVRCMLQPMAGTRGTKFQFLENGLYRSVILCS